MVDKRARGAEFWAPIADAVDAILAERGSGSGQSLPRGVLRQFINAAALMYIHASPEERYAFEVWGEAVSQDRATVDRPPSLRFERGVGVSSRDAGRAADQGRAAGKFREAAGQKRPEATSPDKTP